MSAEQVSKPLTCQYALQWIDSENITINRSYLYFDNTRIWRQQLKLCFISAIQECKFENKVQSFLLVEVESASMSATTNSTATRSYPRRGLWVIQQLGLSFVEPAIRWGVVHFGPGSNYSQLSG